MEDDAPEPRERSKSKGPRPDKPRGRGLGAPTATVFRCARCGHKRDLSSLIESSQACSSCGADLHTCSNCTHFDTSAPNECRKEVKVAIRKKATRNECDLFEPKVAKEFKADSGKPDDPKAAFDSLFDF